MHLGLRTRSRDREAKEGAPPVKTSLRSQRINNESANDVCSDVVAYAESCPRQVSLIRGLAERDAWKRKELRGR